jgi:hypothetical protein
MIEAMVMSALLNLDRMLSKLKANASEMGNFTPLSLLNPLHLA